MLVFFSLFAFLKVLVERSVSTPKDVQKNGDMNVRLVDFVLEEVKQSSFGVDCLEPVEYVERLNKQDVNSTFSSYNIFNHLQIEELEEEDALNDSETEVTNGIAEECLITKLMILKIAF